MDEQTKVQDAPYLEAPRKEPKFNSTVARAVAYMYGTGMTDAEIAAAIDVHVKTLEKWRKMMPDFASLVKEQKELADAQVEMSLYQRAIGYTYTEVKHATHEGVFTDEREVEKHVPPDVQAITFWLRNRKPDQWREKSKEEYADEAEAHALANAPITLEQRLEMIARLKEQKAKADGAPKREDAE